MFRKQLVPRAFALVVLLVAGGLAFANDVVVLLDNSGSMKRNDPERLLKRTVIEMIERLPSDMHIGVISFDSAPTALVALGERPANLEAALSKIDYQGQLTDTPAAVERALYELRDRGNDGARHIVLITDGIVDLGDVTANRRAEDWLTGALVDSAAHQHILIHAIAFSEGADYRILQGVTEATGGTYYRAANIDELKLVLDRLREVLQRDSSVGLAEVNVPEIHPLITVSTRVPIGPAEAEPGATQAAPSTMRWWVVTLVMFAMVGVAGGAVALTIKLYQRLKPAAAGVPSTPTEYFPECYLIDLDGVTPSMRHALRSRLNIISRLKNPPDDGMNYIYIPRPNIGRRHAVVEYRDLSFWIKDLGSVNGTRLNGKRVTSEQRLEHGDRVKFHTYEFEFSVADLAYSEETESMWQRARR